MGVRVVNEAELPLSRIARELVGADHGGLGACILFVDAPPGGGPSPHMHPYEEVLIVLEGEATVTAAGNAQGWGAGNARTGCADTSNRLTNTQDGALRPANLNLCPNLNFKGPPGGRG